MLRPASAPLRLVLLIACALLPLAAPGAGPAPRLPDTFDVPAIDAYLSALVSQPGRVGFSVALVKDGQVVLAKGYGLRSLVTARPVEPDTLFAIGSVTKQFTCAAIFLLAEDGKLSVRDPVAKYFPDLTRAKDITLLDLMNNVSGYPDYYPLDFVDRRMMRPIEADELLRQYAGGRLDFEPGSRYSYSNTGFILLGRVIEKVSGESYGEFLTKRIFKPLGMDNTVFDPGLSDRRLASGHNTFVLSDPEPVAPEAKGWAGAAGALYSTPGDLAKWDLALLDRRILKPDSYLLMTTPRRLSTGKYSDYACGLAVRLQAGRHVVTHSGAVSGFAAWSGMIPSTRSAVIMMCNLEGGLGGLPGQLMALLLKDPTNIPAITGPPAAEVAKAVFAEYQSGKVNRRRFSEEFNYFLTDDKLAGASRRLKSYGAPRSAETTSRNERGGMEVSHTRLSFRSGVLIAEMYRRPDGLIEQFFVTKE